MLQFPTSTFARVFWSGIWKDLHQSRAKSFQCGKPNFVRSVQKPKNEPVVRARRHFCACKNFLQSLQRTFLICRKKTLGMWSWAIKHIATQSGGMPKLFFGVSIPCWQSKKKTCWKIGNWFFARCLLWRLWLFCPACNVVLPGYNVLWLNAGTSWRHRTRRIW